MKTYGKVEAQLNRYITYATSRKFAGSIPDEVIGFFN
jgi:hypothetical protein